MTSRSTWCWQLASTIARSSVILLPGFGTATAEQQCSGVASGKVHHETACGDASGLWWFWF